MICPSSLPAAPAKEQILQYRSAQFLYRAALTSTACLYYLARSHYRALARCCRVKRLLPNLPSNCAVERLYAHIFRHNLLVDDQVREIADNQILLAFLASREARAIREEWQRYGSDHVVRLKYPRSGDNPARQGNLIVIKRPDPSRGERGVLYLRFNQSFTQFAALFNLPKIAKQYRIVMEPSWWGYMEELFHLFIGNDLDVVVQAQDVLDYSIIEGMHVNLVPIRLGAGDWIDTDVFDAKAIAEKIYDVIMIANWSDIKRHHVLFRAVATEKLRDMRIVLIGYPSGGRTRDHIEQEATNFGIREQIDIYERLPSVEVARLIRESKVAVMLTKREGANRAIYECLLSGTPVILYRHNRGVNRDIINKETGCLADDDELGRVLQHMVNNYSRYRNVAAWAHANTGRKVAHAKLDACLRAIAERRGEMYSTGICEISAAFAAYVSDTDRQNMQEEYASLTRYIR